MRSDKENEYLLKAVDAFKRRMCVISPDFKILACNRQASEFVGSYIIGKPCYTVFSNRSSPCPNCSVNEVKQTRRTALRPKMNDVFDLGMLPCIYSYPLLSGDTIEALVSMDFDLPTRGGLEEKLERTNSFLRNLILSSVHGVIAADKTGRILFFNDAACEIFGYTVEEAVESLNVRDIYPGNKAYQVMEKLRSEEYSGRGKLKSFHIDVLAKSGETIPVSLNASIVYDRDKDRELATVGYFHDLREEMKIKEELEKTRIQLLQAEKMSSLGKLAAGVAHQLNNPLGGIVLYTKLIMEEYDIEKGMREDLIRILDDAERCRDTVKELLEFTRQTRHLMRPNDINEALSRTLFLLENKPLFQNIGIKRALAPSLPMVYSDAQQLNHMFMNIIINAAQAMEGAGTLTTTTYRSSDTNKVCIEISDTGPGIPKDVLPNIFDPFFTTKQEGEGTGLGLSLVYSIVENHGGKIKAWNRSHKGTTFFIELPISRSDSGGNNNE